MCHSLGRKRPDRHAERAGTEFPKQCAQRMTPGELVVAKRRDHKSRHGRESPSEQTQDVKRRFVCPVDVLDQNDGGPGRELADELGRERVRLRPTRRNTRKLATYAVGDLEERAKRARSVQRLAGGAEDAHRLAPTR